MTETTRAKLSQRTHSAPTVLIVGAGPTGLTLHTSSPAAVSPSA